MVIHWRIVQLYLAHRVTERSDPFTRQTRLGRRLATQWQFADGRKGKAAYLFAHLPCAPQRVSVTISLVEQAKPQIIMEFQVPEFELERA